MRTTCPLRFARTRQALGKQLEHRAEFMIACDRYFDIVCVNAWNARDVHGTLPTMNIATSSSNINITGVPTTDAGTNLGWATNRMGMDARFPTLDWSGLNNAGGFLRVCALPNAKLYLSRCRAGGRQNYARYSGTGIVARYRRCFAFWWVGGRGKRAPAVDESHHLGTRRGTGTPQARRGAFARTDRTRSSPPGAQGGASGGALTATLASVGGPPSPRSQAGGKTHNVAI